jgi:3-oxoacyl-[acyl-carrier-protein] synthase-3
MAKVEAKASGSPSICPPVFHSRIIGIGHWLPDDVVTSESLERELGLTDRLGLPPGFIERTTGVRERRRAPPGMNNSEIAALASIAAIRRAGIAPEDIDCLIFAACGQDLAEPATANMVQDRVGALGAHAFDVKNACNAWMNALDIADAFIAMGKARYVLIAAGEFASFNVDRDIKTVDELTRKLAGLTLGDAGAAAVVAPSNGRSGIVHSVFRTDGQHWPIATVKGGGTRFGWGNQLFESSSAELLALAEAKLPPVIWQACRATGWTPQDFDVIVPHQVSKGFTRKMCQMMNVPFERCLISLDRCGNCGAASVPLALSLGSEGGRLQQGDRVVLVAAAAGFSVGITCMVW